MKEEEKCTINMLMKNTTKTNFQAKLHHFVKIIVYFYQNQKQKDSGGG